MAISSINFAKSSGGSFAHNDRTEKEPNYLLPVEHRLENECNRSALEAQKMLEDLFENAKENYSKTYGQKFQTKFENVHWEAVINLNKEHTIKDVERLVREIEKETGFTAVQISIHRDEGHINEKTGYPIHNLHAHVNFFTLDPETGQQLYRRSISNSEREKIRKEHGIPDGEKIPKHLTAVMDKAKLSKLQDITAKTLGMERGERGSTKVRLGHKQHRAVEQEKEKLLAKIEELQKENTELSYNFRDMQKQITALEGIDAEQKKELHRLNTEANKTKDQDEKDLKISELIAQVIAKDQTIDQLKNEFEKSQPHTPIIASKFVALQDENDLLKITNSALERELQEEKTKGAVAINLPMVIELFEETRNPENIGVEAKERKAEIERKLGDKPDPIAELERASYKQIEEKGVWTTTTKTVFDKDVFIQKVKERENNHQNLHKINNTLISSLNNALKSVIERSKKGVEAIFSKITGKSLPETQKERTEALNAQKEKPRGLREAVDELNKQKEPKRGMER